jgi:signal transduction histidine kinase/ActR/RegA family two-component response regulator
MSDYRLSDLLDLSIVQKMAESHYRAAGMPIGIIDAIDGSILVGSGWQDICSRFHRTHPVALTRCQESDNYIKGRLIEGEACHYKCKNGLWDIGVPIVVASTHLATMFLGQFFYEGEAPDRQFFIRQAHEFGFDVDGYLKALDAVPVFSREKVDTILEYDKALVRFIADLAERSLSKIKAEETIRSERLRAENERQKLQDKLALSQKMESVGRLAGGVAHDFNNMLGVILGNAELALIKIEQTHAVHGNLTEIRKAASRSADLTRQLLAFARKQTMIPRVLDLNDTVNRMIEMLRRLLGENIDLAWMPGRDLWPVWIDPAQIDQILMNLAANARDAIDGVGKVCMETVNVLADGAGGAENPGLEPGEYVMLAVSDNGCGMDREALPNIFDPFYTTKETGKGTGLGLATVYGIVRQNNGLINVYSEAGKGTSFKIYLPRHQGESRDSAKPAPLLVTGGAQTVLVVEDEAMLLAMARAMLERLGYSVLAAATPSEAMRLAAEHAGQIDLLMTDVVMPEMNGRDLAQQLLSLYPGLKQLFMSGYTANVIAHQGVMDKNVQFLQKPFTLNDLAAKVREALGRNYANRQPISGKTFQPLSR